jgi:hypothetical protein
MSTNFAPFLIGLYLKSSLDTNCVCHLFTQSIASLFISLTIHFTEQMILILLSFNLSFFLQIEFLNS